MVSDTLMSINACLASLGNMIPQTENEQLRQTLQQIRNSTEKSQYDLYKMAKEKEYYMPSKMALENEIVEMKENLINMSSDKENKLF